MKSLLFRVLIAVLLLTSAARAQTIKAPAVTLAPSPAAPTASATPVSAPLTQQTFIQTAYGYFTVFNTNLTTTFSVLDPYEVWTGAAYQSGVNLGLQLGAEGNPFKNVPGLMLGEVSTFAPQVGVVADEEMNIGWSFTHIDTRLTFGLTGMYCFGNDTEGNKGLKGGFFVEVQKALTTHTFSGIRGEALAGGGALNQLVISAEVGTTF